MSYWEEDYGKIETGDELDHNEDYQTTITNREVTR